MKFDCVVIGAGPGGYVAALRAARRGLKTAVVEKEYLGGTCLNWGCIPTKALLHVSELADQIRHAGNLGITTDGVKIDYAKAAAYKDKVVTRLRQGVAGLLKNLKVQVFNGTARLDGPRTVVVTYSSGKAEKIEADKIIIATGTAPAKLDTFPFDGKTVMDTNNVLAMTTLPKSLLVVGGGIAGCEFATMFAEFGSKVTVVELLDSLLPGQDPDISRLLARVFKQKNIEVHTSAKIIRMTKSTRGITAELQDGQKLTAACALVAIGRTTDLAELTLDKAGLQHDGRFIKVDQQCRTNVPNIYAIGEVSGAMPLAHVASKMGIVAAENAAGSQMAEDFSVVPFGIFTHPEIGVVGLSEAQAKEKNLKLKVASFPLQALGIAQAYDQTTGFVKIVADQTTGEILGACMVGPHAADVIQQIALAIKTECTVEEIVETIHTHPTFSEALAESAESWLGQALHSL